MNYILPFLRMNVLDLIYFNLKFQSDTFTISNLQMMSDEDLMLETLIVVYVEGMILTVKEKWFYCVFHFQFNKTRKEDKNIFILKEIYFVWNILSKTFSYYVLKVIEFSLHNRYLLLTFETSYIKLTLAFSYINILF